MRGETEGIVLRATLFREYDRIVTLMTPEYGLVKLFVKGRRKDPPQLRALTTPLTRGHYHYITGRGDLHRLTDGTLLDQNIYLRDRYETLRAAQEMTEALLASQWENRAAPALYVLYCKLLEHLPQIKDPQKMVPLFYLKILKHEGLLHHTPSLSGHRYGGEIFLAEEAPQGSLRLSAEEEGVLAHFAGVRSLDEACKREVPEGFDAKVRTLFEQAIK